MTLKKIWVISLLALFLFPPVAVTTLYADQGSGGGSMMTPSQFNQEASKLIEKFAEGGFDSFDDFKDAREDLRDRANENPLIRRNQEMQNHVLYQIRPVDSGDIDDTVRDRRKRTGNRNNDNDDNND